MSNPTLRWCGNALIGFGVLMVVWAVGLSVWPRSYVAKVRLNVGKGGASASSPAHYDPYWIQSEFEKIQSKVVLYEVITNLNLNQKWSEQGKKPVDVPNAYTMLKRQMNVRQPRNSTMIEIEVRSYDPIEAAAMANEVARVFREQPGQPVVEIIDLATAPGRPVFPSLRLAIGSWFLALASIGMGIFLRSAAAVSPAEGAAASSELA